MAAAVDFTATLKSGLLRVAREKSVRNHLPGTWLDVELMQPLANPGNKTLKDRWSEWDPKGDKTGQGFNRSPRLKQTFVDFLASLPVFQKPKDGFEIEFDSPATYGELYGTNSEGQSSAHMPRRKELFEPPVVIVPQSPGTQTDGPKAFFCKEAIAFSQSYYGYSCADLPHSKTLAALLYLLPHTTLFAYFCLMTSRRTGFDRQTFNKEEFDALPFPDIGSLSKEKSSIIRDFATRLQKDTTKPWQELNEFIFELYGLNPDDVRVAEDTLFAASSYRHAGRSALESTSHDTRLGFVTALRDSLEPYFDVCGEHVAVREADFQPDAWKEP